MNKESTELTKPPAFEAATEMVVMLLAKGVSVPDISFALAYVATDLALQFEPSADQTKPIDTEFLGRTVH